MNWEMFLFWCTINLLFSLNLAEFWSLRFTFLCRWGKSFKIMGSFSLDWYIAIEMIFSTQVVVCWIFQAILLIHLNDMFRAVHITPSQLSFIPDSDSFFLCQPCQRLANSVDLFKQVLLFHFLPCHFQLQWPLSTLFTVFKIHHYQLFFF